LWKAVQVWTDLGWADLALHFIRDRDRREVDFLVTRDGKPWFLVEVKLSEVRPADTLDYFCNRLHVPGLQMVLTENVCRQAGQILVVSANRWLGHLP
jgi:uncharacterized protein